jgi:hypothetical protein
MKDERNIFNPTTLSKGLLKDVTPSKHNPENTSFVLNGIYDDSTGQSGSLQNEPGNTACWELPTGFIPVGHKYINNRGMLVMSTNGLTSELGLADNCKYSTLIRSSCLNFDPSRQVKALYRRIQSCGDIIYFYDGENFDKSINLNDLAKYTQDGSVTNANANDTWDCNKMKLEPDFIIPFISDTQVKNAGGTMEHGNWQFAIEILDSDLNRVGFSQISNSVSIFDESVDAGWTTIDGGLTGFNQTPPTTKAVKLSISNLDTRFSYFRVWAVRYTTEDGVTPEVFSKGDVVSILNPNEEYIFTGVDVTNNDVREDIEALVITGDNYIASKAMEFVDKRLVRANLKKNDIDWSEFQRTASKIKARYTVKEVPSNATDEAGSEKNPNTTFEAMSHMGDEVYAYSIVYEFKQGFYSPPFLTIGRPANSYEGTIDDSVIPDPAPGQAWDDGIIPVWNKDIAHLYDEDEYNALPDSEKLKRYQVYNTAIKTNSLSGEMAYHQNHFSTYPIVKDCNGDSIWGTDAYGNELEGTPIRHHKFPDRLLEKHYRPSGDAVLEQQTCYDYVLPSIASYDFVAVRIVYTIDDGDPIEFYEVVKNPGDSSFNPPLDHTWLCVDPERIVTIVSQNCYIQNPDTFNNPDTIEFTIETNTSEFVSQSGIIRLLGIEFSNIQYPHPDIVRHHFVRGVRDSINRNVVDKGVLGQLREKTATDEVAFAYFPTAGGENSNFNYFFSAKNLIDGAAIQGEYLHLEGDHHRQKQRYVREFNDTFLSNDDFYIGVRWMRYGNQITQSSLPYNLKIKNTAMINPMAKQTVDNHEVVNLSMSNKLNVLQTEEVLDIANFRLRYASVKTTNDVWGNPFTIRYVRTHNGGLTLADSQTIYGGDTFVTNLRVANMVTRGITDGIWSYIWAALATLLTAAITVVTAGAGTPLAIAAGIAAGIGLTATAAAAVLTATKEGRYDAYLNNNEGDFQPDNEAGTGFQYIVGEYINMWVESEYNYGMRHDGFGDCDSYFKGIRIEDLIEYFSQKATYYDEPEEELRVKPMVCPEVYNYNKGYNALSGANLYIPLDLTHDYCQCARDTNSIIWSEKAFEEELADGMRIFLPLNRDQVGNHAGEITNLHYDRNRMLLTTTDSLFVVSPNPRILKTDQETVYTGTGAFFSIPEIEMTKVDWGFGGNQGRFNAITTPFGWIYVDQKEGHVHLVGSKHEVLSNAGLYYWFKENLPSQLLQSVGEYDLSDSIAHFSGVGLMSTYDPTNRRYILHKRDFKLLKPFGGIFGEDTLIQDHLYFNPENNLWYHHAQGVSSIVTLDNEFMFENRSWTISYSFAMQAWVSLHSYLPTYLMNDEETFFTFDKDNVAWKHDKHNYTNYYGKQRPFIVEYIVFNPATNDLNSLHWYSETKEWNENDKSWIDVDNITFNKMLIYNNNQSTGNQQLTFLDKNLNPFGNRIGSSNTEKDIILTEEDYKVSDIRNLASGTNLTTSNWDKIKSEFIDGGYIDMVSDDDNIDYTKNRFEQDNLKSKYHIVRLYFDNESEKDLKLLLNLVNSKTYKSIH